MPAHLFLKSSRQLEQFIMYSPGELHIALKRSGVKTRLSPFCLGADLINVSLNLGIILATFLVVDNPTRSQRLSVYTFIGLYSFAFTVNVAIALFCLKKGQQDPRFAEWLTFSGLEVSVLLLCCCFNTQHIHFLWSQWSFFGALRFNAPRPFKLWKACVRWSLFGFFFSDLMQLFYKVFRLWNDEPLTTLTGLAVATSVLSIGLNLPKKVTFFAIARRSGDDGEEDASSSSAGGEELMGRSRSGGHHHGALYTQDVTVVMFMLPGTDRKSTKRLGVECNAFYTTVHSTVKRFEGLVVHCHGPEVVAVFNCPKLLDNHWSRGLSCALSAVDNLKQLRVRPMVAVTTDILPVGILGSQSRKSFQCCGGATEHLARLCSLAGTVPGCSVVATRKTLGRIDGLLAPPYQKSLFKVRAIPTLVDESIYEVKESDGILASLIASGSTSGLRGATAAPATRHSTTGPPHSLTAQCKLLPLFGIQPPAAPSGRSDGRSHGDDAPTESTMEFNHDTKLMHFIGKRLSKWMSADDKTQGFNWIGDEAVMMPQLFTRVGEVSQVEGDVGSDDDGLGGSGSEDSTDSLLMEVAKPKKALHPAKKESEGLPLLPPPTSPQQVAAKKLRTVGFILGHVLGKKNTEPPLMPEDIDL